ncbi:hypothetical protein T06_7354 [Trichinella sp. T6]|nr:hypothetical protein T06_7354 [Trichinella sp. T6]
MDVMLLKFHGNQDCEIYRITNYTDELKRLLKTEAGLLKNHTKSEIHSKTLTEYMIEGIIERVENVPGDDRRTCIYHSIWCSKMTNVLINAKRYHDPNQK